LTLVVGVAGNATQLKAFIVLPHKTIESKLCIWKNRMAAAKVAFSYQENKFITSASVREWVSDIRISFMVQLWEEESHSSVTVLFMGGYTANTCGELTAHFCS
jgi:hypothetical protein